MKWLKMAPVSVNFRIRVLFAITLLLIPFVNSPNVQAQAVGTVVTIKSITPSLALPGQSMTVKINISVTGGGGGLPGPVDTSLIIDRTGSMYGQKFEDAKAAAKAFIDDQEEEDMSQVIAFSEQVSVQKDFTKTDTSGKTALKRAIDQIIPPYGFTNLYAALEKSVQEITGKGRTDSRRAMILLTDGRPNIGITSTSKFIELAESAASANVMVYTVGLGGPSVPDPVNATLLQEIANAGKGKYYFAPTSSDLKDIYLKISAQIHVPPARNVRVTEHLPSSIVTYNNDASQPPVSISDGTIFWQIEQILAETSWVVTYTVTALKRVTVVQSLSPTTIIYDRGELIDIRIDLPPGLAVREVATIDMAASTTTATEGDTIDFNATVANYGTIPETFEVGLFSNTTKVDTTSVQLSNGSTRVVHFRWNTTGYDPGIYDVAVTADPNGRITGDDPTNNTRTVRLNLSPRYEASILPLVLMILVPLTIIPLTAAAILGRKRGYTSRFPVFTERRGATAQRTYGEGAYRMVCPKCYKPLTYYSQYQKWYCTSCRRYV